MAVKKEIVRTGWREAWGIVLLALCAIGLLSLLSFQPDDIRLFKNPPNDPALNFIGPAGAWFAFVLFMAFGVGGYIVPAIMGTAGAMLIFKREGRVWTKVVWMIGVLIALVCLLDLRSDEWQPLNERLNVGGAGGALGAMLASDLLVRFLGILGAGIVAVAALAVFVILLTEVHPVVIARHLGELYRLLAKKAQAWLEQRRDERAQLEREEREIAKRRRRLEEVMKDQQPPAKAEPREQPAKISSRSVAQPSQAKTCAIVEDEDEVQAFTPPVPEPVPVKRERARPKPEPILPDPVDSAPLSSSASSSFILPPINMLEVVPPAKDRQIKGDFSASAAVLKETLAEFGVEVDVTNVERGPVVTRYELLPAPGVRVERIVGLSNNIALAMKAESVRVQAPIPGKGVVGIEVPNSMTTTVYLREIIESPEWQAGKALPLALGKDVGGRVLVADLADMPHMLIAGATGSGKTVCMNSILAGLLASRTPDQMRLMLIDPKIVEFSIYNHLPHLVVPVITDPKKVCIGLRWAINEMEKRYKIFAKVGVRNIKSYNSRPVMQQTELFGSPEQEQKPADDQPPARMPYIVIVVDELADLMLVAQADIETSIARLAQLSRAVGIHMILATQRPSVNVITGTIKANFPARISFQVAQKVDSRTILDATGADKLLGKGDMLFLPPGSSKLIRAQGTMTTDAEIRRIVDHIGKQGQPQYEVAVKEKMESKAVDLPEIEEDDLLEAAIEIIRQTKRASTSSLQRRLRIGYTRAARLIDLLEERGIVGPPCGSDPREILIDLDGEIPQNQPDNPE